MEIGGVHRRLVLVGGGVLSAFGSGAARADTDWRALTEAQWAARLTPAQFAVLRQSQTEAAGSSDLDGERRRGLYRCAGCSAPVFMSEEKFDSHTGWPSFWRPVKGNVDAAPDLSMHMRRTAVACHGCGGHLGHVFKDGPPPTGLRYCVNGVALIFERS